MSQNRLEDKLRERYEASIRRKRFQLRLIRNWWLIAVLILGIYVGLPMAAPVMMQAGATGPANSIYSVYSFACHQFAFRSIFVFGEQAFYPRDEAGVDGLETFESRAAESDEFVQIYLDRFDNPPDQVSSEQIEGDLRVWGDDAQWTWASRDFVGDDDMGYKMALCQRDIAIYAAMVVAGLIFGAIRHRLRPIPLWIYVLLGLGPIGIDGFGQLLSYPPFEFWDPSETTPFFRILTGTLFGVMNVWLAFPYLQQSFDENEDALQRELDYREHEFEQELEKVRKATRSGE